MRATREDGLRRRDALLDAALRTFVERGVLHTGIEEIRKAARASPSSVYHHFDGLPGLTVALLVRTFERLFASLAARVLPTGSAQAAVYALVDGHLDWVLNHRDEAHFMYQAMALELGALDKSAVVAAKAELQKPVVEHLLEQLAASDPHAQWSVLTLDLVLLGPSHEACRRYLSGVAVDPIWMRSTLPRLAWKCVAPECV